MGDGRVIAPLIRTPFLRKTVVAILFLEEVGPYVTLRPHPWRGEERRPLCFFTAAESGGLGKACFVLVRFNGMLS